MTRINQIRGRIYLPSSQSWDVVDLYVDGNGRIDHWTTVAHATGEEVFVVPGFIDEHVHGAAGFDTMDKTGDSFKGMAQALAPYGVTGFLATSMTGPLAELQEVIAVAHAYSGSEGARLWGLHLEGPYISREYPGAQPPAAVRSMDLEEVRALIGHHGGSAVRLVTLAPELAGSEDVIRWLRDQHVAINIGHTAAAAADAVRAADWGANGVTHLMNAMPSIHHRHPGPVVVGLTDPRYMVEVIADGVHLDPSVIRLIFQAARGRIILVTDGIPAVGLPDGVHHLGSLTVEVSHGAARLANGTLAGSVLTMDQALRNVVRWGIPLEDASYALSEAPAKRLGLVDRGIIAPGAYADLTVLSPDLTVIATIRDGQYIYQRIGGI